MAQDYAHPRILCQYLEITPFDPFKTGKSRVGLVRKNVLSDKDSFVAKIKNIEKNQRSLKNRAVKSDK